MEVQKEVVDSQKKPVAVAVEKALQQEDAGNQDPAVMIRQALANNFIQHCVNAATAEGIENPVQAGFVSALGELLVAVLNAAGGEQKQLSQGIELIANALANVTLGEDSNLAEKLMITWGVAAGRNSKLNSLIGMLRDASEADYRQYTHQRLELLAGVVNQSGMMTEAAPQPVEPQPEAESLPAEDVHTPVSMEEEA